MTNSATNWIGGAGLLVALVIAGSILFFHDGDPVVPFSLLTGFVVMLVAQLRSLQASEETDKKVEVVHGIVNSKNDALSHKIDTQADAITDLKLALASVQDALARSQTQGEIKTTTIDTQATQIAGQAQP